MREGRTVERVGSRAAAPAHPPSHSLHNVTVWFRLPQEQAWGRDLNARSLFGG